MNLDELFLVAQPVVPLDCRDQPAYYEFLLRVRDDEGVARTPDELSDPNAGDEVLESIDGWVIRSTVQWLSENSSASASVNVTPTSVRSGHALTATKDALDEFAVGANRLMLEVPESSVSTDPEAFRRTALAAQDIGFRMAIDDLGNQRGSLATAGDVGVDAIKIDGFWVSRATTEDLAELTIRSIVTAARLIGARVVAEWIEDESTCEMMSRMGIEYGQGWLFGYPQPIEEIASGILTPQLA